MSAPEHRRGAGSRVDPRLLLVAAFLLGALVSGLVVAIVGDGSGGSGTRATNVAHTSTPSPRAGHEPKPAPPSSAAPTGGGPQQWALMTQPLAQLRPGDRVVYNMTACRFRSWVGEGIDVALIACPGERPFQTKTENLVPVEPAQGD
ncbi:hypothetical protein GCM10009844_06220 [Nocardioides koreensis]|uniref:Serine/threonine protein kinase n=1 Tax=Nocardioides koreensis TaxID=433651 RepID=A0ABN2Z8F1_9ACTN